MQPPAQVFPLYPSWQHPVLTTTFFPRNTDDEYPSPAPSHPSPTYSPSEHYPILSHFPQIDSSIGPSRILTRRQRAALEHAHMARRPSNFQRDPPPTYSVPDSTHESHPTEGPDHPERLSLNISGDGNLPLQSPSYHPMTPTSMSSPSYTYPCPQSKSAPESASDPPRVPSPALSAVSALTSVSSASAHLRPYPRPSTHIPTARSKQKKQRLDNHARKEICLYQEQHPNSRQEDIATIFKVERSTISKILKHKTKWLSMPDNLANRAAKHRPSKFPEIEDALIQWLEECSEKKITLSDSSIRSKAKETARMLHISDEKFKASSGWVENFKSRHGIRAGVWAGAAKPSSQPRILMTGPSLDSSILSPLNPAFTSRAQGMDLDAPSPHHHHHDPDSDADSPEQEHDDRHHTRPLPESPVMVPRPPPWSGEQHPNDAPPSPSRQLPPFSHGPSSSSMPQPAPQPTSPRVQHSSSHSQAGLDRHPYLDESAVAVYYQTPHIPPPRMPTLADAEDAINTLITFLDSAGHGILQDHERQALNTVKCALFQAGSGVPFDRSRH